MPTRRELANAIRALSMDAIQKAKSGHPGAPMGMADIAEVLWNDYLVHNPADPNWPNRDRFVLSNGHGSMLIYSLLHLSGYDLPIKELENFRQFHSQTPGHPEYGDTPGVETTTGPLGQGMANAVGMAIAEKVLAAQYNGGGGNGGGDSGNDGTTIIDHYTYVFMGDGCVMEGISHEVCSLAGTLGLGKLIAFYDDNGISIDGEVKGWLTDDTPQRFAAYGWQVIPAVDGHDAAAIKTAIDSARAETAKPSLICCKTIIGWGAPNKQGTADTHGAPLGADEVAATRAAIGWTHEPFTIPEEIYSGWNAKARGQRAQRAWEEKLAAYSTAHPEKSAELKRRLRGELPASFAKTSLAYIADLQAKGGNVATRKASQNCLNAFGPLLPELLGGSADLAPSNLTTWSGSNAVTADNAAGNYLHFGVREFGMTAICNGIALHGGFIPYNATFLVFMEYARNAVRMAALMRRQNIFVYTHDSIGLGEDGPTHQPVEQLTSLRTTPNLSTWRPCDDVESAVAWQFAIENQTGPTALIFSRQNLVHQPRDNQQLANIRKGGYILSDADAPQAILIATGSEVELAMAAARALATAGKQVRVVSMPSVDQFECQPQSYRDAVLPPKIRNRVAVEAGHQDFWHKYVGLDGAVVGMNSFGASAPIEVLMKHFGFTVENVVAVVEALL